MDNVKLQEKNYVKNEFNKIRLQRILLFMGREQIEKIFRAALVDLVAEGGWGAQAKIARLSGVSQSQINDILKGRSYGSEETRRRISSALGYEYENFLDIGRQILGLKKGARPKPKLPFQEQLEEFGEHTEARADFIFAMVGKEMGWPSFANFVNSLPGDKDPTGKKEYLKNKIDDYELYERAKEMLEHWKSAL